MKLKNDLPVLARKLSKVYGKELRIVGPYHCKDGRRRVDVISTCKKKTMLLARVRLEIKLGRSLTKDEEVDHKDEGKTNDSYKNVQVLSTTENVRKQIHYRFGPKKKVPCAYCGKILKVTNHGLTGKRKFCSNSHRGKFYGNQYEQA